MAREKAIGMKCVKDTINPLQQQTPYNNKHLTTINPLQQ